ncbi:hypothetical protein [Actinomadura madurae]|uniref:hypothetical protein n=1 Tax=Actinomadura madurae TaxID=1993 RepID=UPI0020D24DB9|nr:hypothetical protein [Actinomadura madurae]MCP9985152.1 hypothetical protein [Actinomadura madurae]
MDFSSAAGELYGVPPAEFVERRKRLAQEAKADGDAALAKRIGGLRRPTLSAWAVNLLARSASGELDDLLDVGEEMRAAWSAGRGVGDLEQRRAGLVRALVRRAADLAAEAGGPLREQAVREVEDTLQAATVDAGVAEEVRAGRLPQPRSHTGFVPAGFPMAPAEKRERPESKREEKPARRPREKKEPERARSNVTRTSAARAKRAETLRKRAEQAERKLAEREERARRRPARGRGGVRGGGPAAARAGPGDRRAGRRVPAGRARRAEPGPRRGGGAGGAQGRRGRPAGRRP